MAIIGGIVGKYEVVSIDRNTGEHTTKSLAYFFGGLGSGVIISIIFLIVNHLFNGSYETNKTEN